MMRVLGIAVRLPFLPEACTIGIKHQVRSMHVAVTLIYM